MLILKKGLITWMIVSSPGYCVIRPELSGKRPQLTNLDRLRLVVLSHFRKFWKQTLHIVQPDTLLRLIIS